MDGSDPRLLPAIRKRNRTGRFSGELRAICSDGRVLEVDVNSTCFCDSKGVIHAISQLRDISERKRIEDAVRRSEARLKRAELAAKSGNWELHLDTGKMIGPAGAVQLFDLDVAEVASTTIKKQLLPEYIPLHDAAFERLLEDGDSYDIEFKIKTQAAPGLPAQDRPELCTRHARRPRRPGHSRRCHRPIDGVSARHHRRRGGDHRARRTFAGTGLRAGPGLRHRTTDAGQRLSALGRRLAPRCAVAGKRACPTRRSALALCPGRASRLASQRRKFSFRRSRRSTTAVGHAMPPGALAGSQRPRYLCRLG